MSRESGIFRQTSYVARGRLGFGLLCFLVVCFGTGRTAYSAQVGDEWSVPVTISLEGYGIDNVIFGTMAGATDGLDPGIDVLNPPPPPGGFDAFFRITHPTFPDLTQDFRSSADSIHTWNLVVSGSDGGSGSIRWDASQFPIGSTSRSRLEIHSGDMILADMLTVDSLNYSGDQVVTIVLFQRLDSLGCRLRILSPGDGDLVSGDSITVTAVTSVLNGAPPFTIQCAINGINADRSDSLFTARVPLNAGENSLVASCSVTDGDGQQASCADTVTVFRGTPILSEVEILTPAQNEVLCRTETEVTGVIRIKGGVFSTIECSVNGITASLSDSMFTASVRLESGSNSIVALCTVTDHSGEEAACADTAEVFLDREKPSSRLTADGNHIRGTFTDRRSGIDRIVPVELRNGTLVVEEFDRGDAEVDFRIEPVDPERHIGFSVDVYDVCGNVFNCDPFFLHLSAESGAQPTDLTFPRAERYFRLTNYGLTSIHVNLNGGSFRLITDASRAEREKDALLLPPEGTITIDMINHLIADENSMRISSQGPSAAFAELFLLDVSENVDFVLGVIEIPDRFQLQQNYPNPFNPTTNIRYDLPDRLRDGEIVHLRIYNLLGQKVRDLVNEEKPPGQHVVLWDGKGDSGRLVPSGVYLYTLQAGQLEDTRRMILVK